MIYCFLLIINILFYIIFLFWMIVFLLLIN